MTQYQRTAGLAQQLIHRYTPERRFSITAACLISCVIMFDDDVSESEKELIVRFCDSWGVSTSEIRPFLDIPSFQLLADVLAYSRISFNEAGRQRLAEMSLVAALADDVLRHSEVLLVELIVDALDVPTSVIDKVYRDFSGRDFPSKADPSTIEFNESRQRTQSNSSASPLSQLELQKSLNALGLHASATREQIKARYRELALTKHPDRIADKDEATKRQQLEEFLVIKQAYEILMVHHA